MLNLSILIVGMATGVLGALIAYYGYDLDYAAYAGVGFVIGMALMLIAGEVVESAVVALFICLADDVSTRARPRADWRGRGIPFAHPFAVMCVSLFPFRLSQPVTLQRTKPDEYRRLTDPLNVSYPNRGAVQAEMAV